MPMRQTGFLKPFLWTPLEASYDVPYIHPWNTASESGGNWLSVLHPCRGSIVPYLATFGVELGKKGLAAAGSRAIRLN